MVTRALVAVALASTLGACKTADSAATSPAHASPAATSAPAPVTTQPFSLHHLVGEWRWLLRTDEAGTSRIEDEHWQFVASGKATELAGRYIREVEVRSTDGTVFACNQRPWYRQRAVYDVVLTYRGDGFAIHELAYRTEPGPCDHGFRHLGDYTARLAGDRLVLRWTDGPSEPAGGGTQTLWQTSDSVGPLPDAPWPPTYEPGGAWHWEASSVDAAGNIHDEAEQWELVARTPDHLDGTYRRRVTVRSSDGKAIACAGAPSWSFDDSYVIEARRDEEHWVIAELAVDPGDHPCLRATPHRTLDEATAEQLGDNLVLEWRGKRRQVLYRAERDGADAR